MNNRNKKTYMMHLARIVYILMVTIVLISCSHTNKNGSVVGKVKEYDLRSFAQKELFIANGRMAMTDSFLVVVSHQQNNICTLYDVYNRMEEVCVYGNKGGGPTEFIQPLLTYSYGNTFGLNEVNKQELIIMEVDKTSEKKITLHEKKRLKALYKVQKDKWIPSNYYFVKLNDEYFVSLIGTEDGRFFTLSDSTLSAIENFGESPIEEELSAIAARNRLNGRIVAYNGKMAFAATKLPYLALYDMCNEKMVKKWSLYYAETNYGVKNGDLLFDREKAIGPLLDLKMDSKYIYLLYMDQLLSEYDYFDSEKSCSNKIVVFDHSGNKVACLKLDCRIQEMAVFSKELKLYGIAQKPDIFLVEFNLPKELY